MKKVNDIEETVSLFLKDKEPKKRYASFDYCYNYFFKEVDFTKDIEKSCTTLGFYLASWGMLRGSSFLLQQSAKYFIPLIEYYNSLEKLKWQIDIDQYSEENIEQILELYQKTKEKVILKNNTHLVLVTKILMGVFGFIPAFDRFFCSTFKDIFRAEKCGFSVVNKKSLKLLGDFYIDNKDTIDKLAFSVHTIDFVTGENTNINYPKAKIVDMYGFAKNYNR